MRADELETVVFQGIVKASMCWSEIPCGVFDGRRALIIGDEIMHAINVYIRENGGTTLGIQGEEGTDEGTGRA